MINKFLHLGRYLIELKIDLKDRANHGFDESCDLYFLIVIS